MKPHFEPNLDYQNTDFDAVCDLFRGQEVCRTEFTVTKAGSRASNKSSIGPLHPKSVGQRD